MLCLIQMDFSQFHCIDWIGFHGNSGSLHHHKLGPVINTTQINNSTNGIQRMGIQSTPIFCTPEVNTAVVKWFMITTPTAGPTPFPISLRRNFGSLLALSVGTSTHTQINNSTQSPTAIQRMGIQSTTYFLYTYNEH